MTEDRAVPLAELLEEVRRIEAQSTRLVAGIMAGGYSSVFRGSGIEFQQIREYAEGDDPRSVDWNVTARIGRPFVKEFVEERERTLLFVLDLSASMSGGFGHWSARQMAARICACLALAAIESDDRVGLVAFSDGIDRFTPPQSVIACCQPSPRKSDTTNTIARRRSARDGGGAEPGTRGSPGPGDRVHAPRRLVGLFAAGALRDGGDVVPGPHP